jgi:hypothetical protein
MQTRRMVSHQVFFQIVVSHLRVLALEQHAVFCVKTPYCHLLCLIQRNITVMLDEVSLERPGLLRGCDRVCR